MTAGIYILRFNGTNKVYIGQSNDIDRRYTQHLCKLKNMEGYSKLQEAYTTYGVPNMDILIESDDKNLDLLENEAIEIFNSYSNGFNTMKESGHISSLYGDSCGNSKYSNETIEQVLDLLLIEPAITQKEIAEYLNISINVVNGVSCGDTHKWLATKYPDKYEKLESLKRTRLSHHVSAHNRGIVYPPIKSPTGEVYEVTNTRAFAREHGLNHSSLGKVLRGVNKHHLGWKL